uniref:Uncharacterized protein n=1 Tax=Oryza rufipogon TaxID=4529 RepID=A0A0E0NEH3_ORYRU
MPAGFGSHDLLAGGSGHPEARVGLAQEAHRQYGGGRPSTVALPLTQEPPMKLHSIAAIAYHSWSERND